MTPVTVIHVGDFKEKFFRDAEAEYIKRIKPFCDYRTVLIKEEDTHGENSEKLIKKALQKEAERIRAAIPQKAFCIALCVEGKQLSSEELAAVMDGSSAPVCFIIGSSFGLDEDLKKECAMKQSMSKLTFPHNLARVMLAEQIYRCAMINGNRKYHK